MLSAEILSQAVLELAIENYKIEEKPRNLQENQQEILALQQASEVKVDERARSLKLYVQNADPDLARRAANVLARAFVRYRKDIKNETYALAQEKLREEIQSVQRENVLAENALLRLKKQGLNQGLLGQWARRLESLENERASLLEVFTPEHPDLKQVEEQIRTIQKTVEDYQLDESFYAETLQKKKLAEKRYRQLEKELHESLLLSSEVQSDVSILRLARKPSSPEGRFSRLQLLAGAFLLGIFLALLSLKLT